MKENSQEAISFRRACQADMGCTVLRLDTNSRNTRARKLYRGLGYREADIVPCEFNGIPGVDLVCIEKKIPGQDREP